MYLLLEVTMTSFGAMSKAMAYLIQNCLLLLLAKLRLGNYQNLSYTQFSMATQYGELYLWTSFL